MSLAAESWDFEAVDRFYRTAETLYEEHHTLDSEQMDAQAANLASLWDDAYEQVTDAAESYFSSFEEGTSLDRLRPFFIDESPEDVRWSGTDIPEEAETPSGALEKYFRAEELAAQTAGRVHASYDVSVVDELQQVSVQTYVDEGLL